MEDETLWTVAQVARQAGITARALHHYDRIGLLRPAAVDGSLAAELTARLLKAGFTAELAARLVNVARYNDNTRINVHRQNVRTVARRCRPLAAACPSTSRARRSRAHSPGCRAASRVAYRASAARVAPGWRVFSHSYAASAASCTSTWAMKPFPRGP